MKNIKNNMRITIKNLLIQFFCIGFVLISAKSLALATVYQETEPLKTKISLSCTQLANNQIEIFATLKGRIDRKYQRVPDAQIKVYTHTDSLGILIGEDVTDKKGNIILLLDDINNLQRNTEGYYSIIVSYDGSDKYRSSETDLLFKKASLELNAEIIDSVKTITIQLIEIGEEDQPLEDIEVIIEVPRMFSNLPIATESTDEEGKIEIEFPNDLPGRENGFLQIIASVEDTDDHASLRSQIDTDWGVPLSTIDNSEARELWSPNAPLWMVMVFALLIALVWGHFFVIIYKLYTIKKEGMALESD